MKRIVIILIGLISVAYGQSSPTSAKVRHVNGLYVGTKLDSYFNAADSNAVYWRADSVVMAKYKGTARALAFSSDLGVYKLISDTFFTTGYTTRARLKQYGDSLGAIKYTNGGVLTNQIAVGQSPTSLAGSSSLTYNVVNGVFRLANAVAVPNPDDYKFQLGGRAWIDDTLQAATIKRIGGTSSQILLADGSVSSTSNYGQGFTSGSIPYSNGTVLTQDNTNLYWDNTYKFLRLGPNSSRNDFQLNISNTSGVGHAGVSIYQTKTAFNANNEEAAINMQGNLSDGSSQQLGSLNMYWGSTNPSNYFSVIGLHANSNTNSNNDFRLFGGGGIALFSTFDTLPPGNNILRNYGKLEMLDRADMDWINAKAITNVNNPTSGKGLTVVYRGDGSNDYGLIQSYDWSGSTFKPLEISSSTMALNPSSGIVTQNSDTVAIRGFVRGLVNNKLDIGNVSGTSGYVPVFSGSNAIGNSSTIFHSGGLTGFGNTAPAYALDATATSNAIGLNIRGRASDNIGGIRFSSNTNSTEYAQLQMNSSGQYLFYNGSSPTLRATIDNSGFTTTQSVTTGKIIGNSSTPSISGGSASFVGTGATTSVSGNDMAGVITLTTGTGCGSTGASNRSALTVTFASAYASAPIVQIQAIQQGGLSSTDGPTEVFFLRRDAVGTSSFTVYLPVGITLTDSTTYLITYQVIGR